MHINLAIEKITSMVRSASAGDSRSLTTPTPSNPWENQNGRPPSGESNGRSMAPSHATSNGRESAARGSLRDSRETAPNSDRYVSAHRHGRSDSEATGVASSTGYPETAQSGPPRRHDYEIQAMETTPGSPRAMARNPIPPPAVVVRSEFPTINRSRQQQTLTCLITVEVPDNKWRPDPEDLGAVNQPPPMRVEDAFAQRPPSPARSSQPRFYPYEAPEVLEEMTENLRNRVDNWHGLDFNRFVTGDLKTTTSRVANKRDRFGKLRLYGTLRVGKDKVSWQELECYLFAEMLICVKEKKNLPPAQQQWDENGVPRKATRCTLKGSILIKKHLNEVTETGMSE